MSEASLDDYRTDPPLAGTERATLSAFLDWQRGTLAGKCAGLSDDQLRQRAAPPSSMSLLGLVRHLADVERGWFRQIFSAQDVPDIYQTADDQDADFNGVDDGDVAATFATWTAECERARQITAAAASFDDLAARPTRRGETPSLRWIMTHMIEEYARHNGHADLLRERIDGAVGE
jgi:uncharacterized damage-inducible protein DinB